MILASYLQAISMIEFTGRAGRNNDKFQDDFMLQLTQEKFACLKS